MTNLKVTIAFNDNSDSLNEHCPLRSEKMYRQDIVGGGKVVVTVEDGETVLKQPRRLETRESTMTEFCVNECWRAPQYQRTGDGAP